MQSPNLDGKKIDVPDVILGNEIGTAKELGSYLAAKSGDFDAAQDVAKALVNTGLVDRIHAAAAGASPIIQPVYAVEATGENAIPMAAALAISEALGFEVGTMIVQATSPKRTAMQGLERIFNRPSFYGHVESGREYILLDDTLTQGGTFAALERHIIDGGGTVLAAVALTGKKYSSALKISDSTLERLRTAHGDLEDTFKHETGHGFAELTESEARYLASYKPPSQVRDRIVQGKPGTVNHTISADSDAAHRLSQPALVAMGNRLISHVNDAAAKGLKTPKIPKPGSNKS